MVAWATVTRAWEIEVASPHTVRAEHDMINGMTILLLDDQEICRHTRMFWNVAFEHRFAVDGTPCLLRMLPNTWNFQCELWVDAKLQ